MLRTLIFLHQIINTGSPNYLFEHIQFTRSTRDKIIVPIRHFKASSERQFFLYSVSLWNSLPSYIRAIVNANTFKKRLVLFFQDHPYFALQ